MTENTYSIFKRFNTVEQAKEFASILKNNDIKTQIINNSPPVDITFSGNTLQNEFHLKIKQIDFEKATLLLEDEAEIMLDQIDKTHYLFDFTNEELYDILIKPDEWGAIDRKLAQKILNERGKSIDNDLINSLKRQRIDDLSKPEESQKTWIYMGFFTAIIGGLIGLFIGWHLLSFKKTPPNGEKVYAYNNHDRKQGRNILYIGIICFIFWITIQVLIEF